LLRFLDDQLQRLSLRLDNNNLLLDGASFLLRSIVICVCSRSLRLVHHATSASSAGLFGTSFLLLLVLTLLALVTLADVLLLLRFRLDLLSSFLRLLECCELLSRDKRHRLLIIVIAILRLLLLAINNQRLFFICNLSSLVHFLFVLDERICVLLASLLEQIVLFVVIILNQGSLLVLSGLLLLSESQFFLLLGLGGFALFKLLLAEFLLL